MMNMDNYLIWIRKNKVKSVVIIIGLFLFPLLIVHLLFKWNTESMFFSAEWSAGDLISYIAGFEAFIGTVTLGMIAVWQTNKANKTNDNLLNLTEENERKSVLPFLSFNSYITKYVGENVISLLEKIMLNNKKNEDTKDFTDIKDTSERLEFLISEINFTILHNKITVGTELNKEQQKKISRQFGIAKQTDKMAIAKPDYHYTKINVENCGKGAAINVKCRLFKKGHEDDNFDIYTTTFAVSVSKNVDIGLYFDLSKEIKGRYTLEILYYDIYMNKYIQSIPLEIMETEYSIDLYQPQVRCKESLVYNFES